MPESDEQILLAVAHEAAEAAGKELRARFGLLAAGVHAKSTPTDLVSDADLAAEAAIRAVLAERRPGDAIVAEEGGESGHGELRWVVDPLDGTINFLFGIPQFAVSVACEDDTGTLAGVVLDPIREEYFAATRSGRATLDGEPITAPRPEQQLDAAIVATGFAYDSHLRARQAQVLARLLPSVADIRRAGSAAIDLSWCACGRYDAFYERGLHNWDVAAGALVASRAGLEVRELIASGSLPGGILAGPAGLVEELLGFGV